MGAITGITGICEGDATELMPTPVGELTAAQKSILGAAAVHFEEKNPDIASELTARLEAEEGTN